MEFRGFEAELRAERAGEPVYPLWRELPVDPAGRWHRGPKKVWDPATREWQ